MKCPPAISAILTVLLCPFEAAYQKQVKDDSNTNGLQLMSSVTLERTTNTGNRMTSSFCAAKSRTSMAGVLTVQNGSLSKLQSLHGIFAIYKKEGPTSADVLNTLKKALLKGNVRCVFMLLFFLDIL